MAQNCVELSCFFAMYNIITYYFIEKRMLLQRLNILEKITYVGHHGTNSYNANRIIKTNFSVNHKHIGSLGTGIYFFENDHLLAKEYASSRHKGKIIKVIESIIEIPSTMIFDTAENQNDIDTFHDYRREIKINLAKRGKRNIKSQNVNDFDGNIYNFIVNKEGYELIRAKTFTPSLSDRKQRIPNSYVPNGIELCLKTHKYVKDKHII